MREKNSLRVIADDLSHLSNQPYFFSFVFRVFCYHQQVCTLTMATENVNKQDATSKPKTKETKSAMVKIKNAHTTQTENAQIV